MDVKLYRNDLWRQFSGIQNEMIITKRGRNIFPSLQYRISGLEENGLYRASLQLALVDDKKYRYLNGHWDQFEPCIETTHYPREVFQAETKTGKELMKRGISFDKFKITNGDDLSNATTEIIRIQSMRKYIPILAIYKVSRNPVKIPVRVGQFQFDETKFIAVTAYQNTAVKDLKVMNNKYAQGFRENVQKRTSTSPLSDSSSEDSTFSPPEKRQRIEPQQNPQQQLHHDPLQNQENIYPPPQIEYQNPNYYMDQMAMAAAQQQNFAPYFQQQYHDYYNQYWFNYSNQY